MARPIGVGQFNDNSNDFLFDPNLGEGVKSKCFYFVEKPTRGSGDFNTIKALLLECTSADFDWFMGEYDLETDSWTSLGTDSVVPISELPDVVRDFPINSMNLQVTSDEAVVLQAMLGYPSE